MGSGTTHWFVSVDMLIFYILQIQQANCISRIRNPDSRLTRGVWISYLLFVLSPYAVINSLYACRLLPLLIGPRKTQSFKNGERLILKIVL